MISQRDSKVNQEMSSISSEIAQATKADGAAMKTIALVTLTFLPATFVTVCCLHLTPSSSCKILTSNSQALLGMNFFTVDPSSPGGHMKSSKDLWIYFIIAVPLTTIVLCTWWWWQSKEEGKARRGNKMGLNKDVGKADIELELV
jgi:uncharacterized ion transporter superfamily protein YfcC